MPSNSLRSDLVFAGLVTAAWAGLLLVPDGRAYGGVHWWVWRASALLGVGVLGVLWSRRTAASQSPPTPSRSHGIEPLTLVLLLGLTVVAYAEPMRLRFWRGTDEFACLLPPAFASQWLSPPGGRPLLFAPVQAFGHYCSGARIEPFLWLAALLWFANAVLLRAIVRRLTGSTLLATLAAVLLIVHRGEPLRFYVLANALFYLLPVFFFLSGVALWLRSYDHGGRGALVLACAFLALALLMTEGLFPLAAAVPVLAWLHGRRERRRYLAWAGCWYGLVAVLAVKFARYIAAAGSTSYQSQQVGDAWGDPAGLASSLLDKLATASLYVERTNPYGRFALAFYAAALLAGAAVLFAARRRSGALSLQTLGLACAGAVLAHLLGLLPFLHLGLDRSQYFAAPGQVLAVACILLAATRLVPRQGGVLVLVLLVAAISGVAAKRSYRYQTYPAAIGFEKTVRVFEQIHAFAPRFEPGTILLLEVMPGQRSPLSDFNYHVWRLADAVLGVPALQTGQPDPLGQDAVQTTRGLRFPVPGSPSLTDVATFDRLVAFQLTQDGTVNFLKTRPRWPGYDPQARIRAGPVDPLPFLRLPVWDSPLGSLLMERSQP